MPDRERCRKRGRGRRAVHGTSGGRGDVRADAAEVVAGFGVLGLIGREQPGQAADAVHGDDVQRVVEPEAVLEPDGQRGHDAGGEADRGAAERLDEAARGRDAERDSY